MKSESHELFMKRCLELASSGSGYVAPNPMVGAVIVSDGKIIGEGFHQKFGGPHAEVNAIEDAIHRGHEDKLGDSVIYVNLEPCSHFGKTPPCTSKIIHHRIPAVVIGCKDPFANSSGRGVTTLSNAGVEVIEGVLKEECRRINRRFLTFHEKSRPYIIIKFAKTADGFMAPLTGSGKISNPYSDILVHKWRSEEAAILIGTRTANLDNPALTVRHWTGNHPVRIIIDRNLTTPKTHQVYDGKVQTLFLNALKEDQDANIEFVKTPFQNLPVEICKLLFDRNILSVMIEGGSHVISQFLTSNLWDEARIITSSIRFGDGLKAPDISGRIRKKISLSGDEITFMQSMS